MAKLISLGIGAGLVSALLFGVVTTGRPAGMLLGYLAPLPILIVALGWHHLLGLLGVAAGAVATSLLLRPAAGLAFAFGPAFPAWCLAYLLLTARAASPDGGRPTVEWLPLGRFVLWIGLAGTFVAVAVAVAMGRGDDAAFTSVLTRVAERLLRIEYELGRSAPLPTVAGIEAPTLVAALVIVTPSVFAAIFTLALAVNAWLAAKAVALSGRLPRPWSPVADIRMPPHALGVLAVAAAAAFASGWAGIGGRALVGGIGMAFALQGLAFLHAVTRGRPARSAILTLSYMLTLFFGGTFLPLMALTGMVDSVTSLRRRLSPGADGGRRPPPVPPNLT